MKPLFNRRMVIAGLTALSTVSAPASAGEISLDEMSRYIKSIKSAKSTFTQINANGSIDTGTLYIKRPGKIRFEYDAPNNALVLASAGAVAIFGPRKTSAPQQYPLRRTPLGILLNRKVDLKRSKMIQGKVQDGSITQVLASDPKTPQAGKMLLSFTDGPVQLRQWVIVNEAGEEITTILHGVQEVQTLPNRLFSIESEKRKRGLIRSD
jgi:outer membrane lipoprotein-sorting protein